MKDLPFAKYDFWAYLSSGFLLLYVADYLAMTKIFERPEWTVVQSVVAISAAYVVGHLVAGLSSFVLERWLTGTVLGPPREVLFGHVRASSLLRKFVPGYVQPLPQEIQNAALAKAADAGIIGSGEALFSLAFAEAKDSPGAMPRLESFLNLYGFCRNVALVCFLSAIALAVRAMSKYAHPMDATLALAALFVGLGMTLRYLKFLRLYAVEVFTNYATKRPKT